MAPALAARFAMTLLSPNPVAAKVELGCKCVTNMEWSSEVYGTFITCGACI